MSQQLGALVKGETVVTPIIHLNGDRPGTLIATLREAYKAIRTAQVVLRECAPNARNYYPEPGRFEKAVAQHKARLEALQSVMNSLVDEVEQIHDEAGQN